MIARYDQGACARYHLTLATSLWGRSLSPRPPPSCSSCSWRPSPPPAFAWDPPTPSSGYPGSPRTRLSRCLEKRENVISWIWVMLGHTWSSWRRVAPAPCRHPDYQREHSRSVACARLQSYWTWSGFLATLSAKKKFFNPLKYSCTMYKCPGNEGQREKD